MDRNTSRKNIYRKMKFVINTLLVWGGKFDISPKKTVIKNV